MTETENYPGQWQGEIPEDYKTVARGEAWLRISLSACLEYIQHLTQPIYRALAGQCVLDPACGTGEALLQMAATYKQVFFTACDSSAEALAQAKQYAEKMELTNITFLTDLPDQARFDFILPTRPLQHIVDLTAFLAKLQDRLAAEGVLIIHAYTGSHPEENLYLQDSVAEMKAGKLNDLDCQDLIIKLLAQPMQGHIDGLRECNQILEQAGFKLLSGLHPRGYEPQRYIPVVNNQLFSGFSAVDKAYLAEQFNGTILRHSLLYTHSSYHPEIPSFHDPQAAKYIPFLSPYAGARQMEDRKIVSLVHEHLMLPEGMKFEDLSLPEDLYRILPVIDGKINFEQIHRRFLPLPWDRFWALIQACWEEEIIYLHHPKKVI